MLSRLKLASIFLLLALMLSLVPAGNTSGYALAATTCDWAQFVADVTVPDGTNFAPGTAFRKTWRLRNIGTCTWTTSYSLVFDSGDKFGAPTALNFPINVNPGQTVDLSLDMTAPGTGGHFFSYWKLRNASGVIFGIGSTANKSFWAEINVNATPGVAYDFTAKAATEATWSSGAGIRPFPGTEGDALGFATTGLRWIFEDNSSPQSSILVAPQNITNGYIQGIYTVPFRVQKGDVFDVQVGCEYTATSCYVQYRLDYQVGSGPVRNFWTFREKWEGLTKHAKVSLDILAGQDVKFILAVSAYGSAAGDRALWGNPVVTRAGGVPPTFTPTPITPTVTGTPPTATPTKTVTPSPSGCDRVQFISDVTVPDGTSFAPGIAFTKTWRLKNVGSCTWTTSYQLIFDHGDQMGGPNTAPMPTTVAPGQTVDITINLTAPTTANSYRGFWKFKNASGAPFGLGTTAKPWWVDIKVSGTGTVPITVTPVTPVTPASPAAGASYDFAANYCAASWFSAAGSTPIPCPFTNGDPKGFVLYQSTPKLENGALDTRPGLLTFPQNINNGYIQGIYPSYNVKAGDRFRATIGCEGGATSCYVVYRLDFAVSGSNTIQTFWAFVEKLEGMNYNVDLDLNSLAGQNIKFILTVLSTGPATDDRALWIAPMIYNPASAATATPTPTLPLTVTPSITNTPATPTATNTPITPTP